MGKGTGASGRGGTRPTPSAFVAAAVASISRRVAAPPVAGFPPPVSENVYKWSEKAIRRKTTGTGRMRYLRYVAVRFKTNFRQGSQAAPRKNRAAVSA